MKLLVKVLLVIAVSIQAAYGQTKTSQTKMSGIIYDRVERVLEIAGVLVSETDESGLNKHKLKASKAMRSNFRKEFTPLDDVYGKQSYAYHLVNWDLTYLGSTLFNNSKFDKPKSLDKPELPIIQNNKQFIVLSAGKFNLFYSITEFTNMAVNIDVESKAASFVHAKLKSGLQYAKEDKKTFSVSSGLFENELARIISDANTNSLANKSEFFPLYLIWQLYANKVLDKSKKYHIIKNIDAVIWHRDDRSGFNSHTDINAALQAGTPTLPFFKANVNSKTSWKREKSKRADFSLYDVYIMKEPKMVELISHDQILKVWNTLSDDYNSEYGINLSPTEDNIVELTFGPISEAAQHSNISVAKDHFLNQFKVKGRENEALITDVNLVGEPQPENNSVKVRVKFTPNPGHFPGSNGNSNVFSEIKQLKLKIGDTIDAKSLSKTYNITFNADATMVPKVTIPGQNGDPQATLKDSKYTWKFNIDFISLPSKESKLEAYDILQKSITFTHQHNEILKGPGYLLKGVCEKDPNVSTRFNCEIELKDPKNLLSPSEDFLSCELSLKAIVDTKKIKTPYTRKIPIVLRGIKPPTKINNDVVAFESPEKVALFFNSKILIASKSFEEVKSEFSDPTTSKVDYNKIGDIIIKEFNLSRDLTSGKYLVASELVDIEKYLLQQKEEQKKN